MIKTHQSRSLTNIFFLLWTHHTHAHTQQSHLVSNVCRLLHSVAMCVFTALKYQKSAITCSSPIKTARSCSSKGTWSSPAQRQSLFRFLDMTAKVCCIHFHRIQELVFNTDIQRNSTSYTSRSCCVKWDRTDLWVSTTQNTVLTLVTLGRLCNWVYYTVLSQLYLPV